MEKIFNLLDVAIAVLLLVIALSLQLYDNRQVTDYFSSPPETVPVKEAKLRYYTGGMELAAQLSILAEKEDMKIVYHGKEYNAGNFYQEVLGIRLSEEERGFVATEEQRNALSRKRFQMYRQDGKWRIE